MSEQNQLPFMPAGWIQTALDSFCEITQGQSPPSSTYNTEGKGLPFFQGKAEFGDIYPTVEKWCTEPSKIAEQGDVLISIRAPVGPTNLAPSEVAIGRGLAAIHPLGGISNRYVLYALRNTEGGLAAQGTGSTFAAISGDVLRSHKLPLAPLAEQQRIVDEIEKQFSRLDAAVEMLRRVARNLERLRAATLKAAVEGRLVPTEAELARAEGRDYEPADVLLQRILRERRAKWEADQLAKMKEQGKTPKDDKWKLNYPEPDAPYTNNLAALPEGWTWASVDQSIIIIDYRGRTPPFSESGIPHLRSSNVRNGKIIWEGLAYVSEETYEAYMTRGLPEDGDVLFTTEAPLGAVALAPMGKKFSVAQRMMILRPIKGLLSPKFLMYQIMALEFQGFIKQRGTGSTVLGVSSRNFRPTPIRIPPLAEQKRIAEEVERRISVIEELKTLVTNALRRAAVLRQKILRDAFAGKLVPQDPADEPASLLLERIRAERAGREADARQSRKGRKGKMKGRKAKPSQRKTRRSLREVVAESKRRLTPEQLFAEAGFTPEVVEDFYEELRREIKAGHIEQVRPDNAKVYLLAANA